MFDRQGRVRNFDLIKFLSDCEVPDSLQPWAVGNDGYIGKDADVAAITAERGPDYWQVLPPCDDSIGGRGWIVVLRIHLAPRTALVLPTHPPPGLRLEQLGPSRETMLQFTDGRQALPSLPGRWLEERLGWHDMFLVGITEADVETLLLELLDPAKALFYGVDEWSLGDIMYPSLAARTPKNKHPKWTGVTVFRAYAPNGPPEPEGP